jgi:hypothetical protein
MSQGRGKIHYEIVKRLLDVAKGDFPNSLRSLESLADQIIHEVAIEERLRLSDELIKALTIGPMNQVMERIERVLKDDMPVYVEVTIDMNTPEEPTFQKELKKL